MAILLVASTRGLSLMPAYVNNLALPSRVARAAASKLQEPSFPAENEAAFDMLSP